jgi:superfamily II DNA/RNA helicase
MNDISLEQGAIAAADTSFASSEVSSVLDAAVAVAEQAAGSDADAGVEAAPALPNAFVELGLAPELVQAVADLGYTQPTAVQEKAIPLAMSSGGEQPFIDLMVSSQTGSGKTAAFLLPVLHTLIQQKAEEEAEIRAEYDRQCAEAAANGQPAPKRNKRKDPTNPRNFKAATPGALILCPTRELAQQVAHDAIELVKHCRGIRIANVVGGMPYQLQIAKLQNANLVVATPGRLLDLQRSLQIKLDQVQFLVVDEADRMLDLGFSDDLAELNELTAQRKQTMMFSATFAPRIQQLAMRVMHDGGSGVKKITIDTPQEKHANIKQVLFWADNSQHKRKLLHGALSQGLRNRRLMALRNGQVQVLVATDVAARGIDVPTITHVFNYGLPMKAEDYTHRIGRTGRAGREGVAVTFAEFRDRRRIFDIEGYSRQQFKAEVIPGLEPVQRAPSSNEGRGGRRGGFEGRGGDRRGGGGRGFGGDRDRGFGGDRERSFGDRGFGDRGGDRGFGARRDSEGYGRKAGFGGFGGGQREGGYGQGQREGGYGQAPREGGGYGQGPREGGFGRGGEARGFGGDRGAPRGGDRREGGFREGGPREGAPRDGGFRGASGESRGFGGESRGGFGGGDRRPAFGKSAPKPYQPQGDRKRAVR